MSEGRPDFDALSAYVDGELAPEQAARVAAAAASDPEVAGQLATLHALRASVSRLKPEVVISPLNGSGRPRGRRARAGHMLLFAGAAAVVIVAALAWNTRTAPVAEAELPHAAIQPLIDDHDAWIATGVSDYREVAARSDEFRQLLAQAGLDLVHVVVAVDDAGRLTRHYGFLGSRGCRLSLFESPGAVGAGAVATAVDAAIEGVAAPRALTVGELKGMGLETVAMVLQCSGNGRGYFEHGPSGTPWEVGAAGNVIWTGVPLRTVVDELGGLAGGANFITGTGGEEMPDGVDPKDVIVERSVPIDTLDTVLLAWDLNGEPISLAHGGPLRIIVPGFTGVNDVKYVKRVAFTEAETDALIQASRYRLQPIGEEGGPEHPSVWAMSVKSWINGPLEGGSSGLKQITGVAFGGINAVESVEVSVDGGEAWHAAEFVGPDLGRYAWRVFVLPMELAPGSYRLVSRATDSEGNQQPRDPELNDAGYNHNGWDAPGIDITVG